MEQFHFSKQAMLSTWYLRMYLMPLWCWWEAKPVGGREIETKICLSKPGSRVRTLSAWLDPAAGSSKCCVLMAGVAPPVPPSRVCKCLCLQGEGALRVRDGDDFLFQQELAVKTQLNVVFKLNLQWCFGTQWSFAPYLKSCGKPNSI